jgi:hypothetical protein
MVRLRPSPDDLRERAATRCFQPRLFCSQIATAILGDAAAGADSPGGKSGAGPRRGRRNPCTNSAVVSDGLRLGPSQALPFQRSTRVRWKMSGRTLLTAQGRSMSPPPRPRTCPRRWTGWGSSAPCRPCRLALDERTRLPVGRCSGRPPSWRRARRPSAPPVWGGQGSLRAWLDLPGPAVPVLD